MPRTSCQHRELLTGVSDFGLKSVYKRVGEDILAAAATEHDDSRCAKAEGCRSGSSATFPAPLVLPYDLLALDDEDEPQTLHEYLHYPDRNKPTSKRNTIYLVQPPKINKSVSFMEQWSVPVDSTAQDETSKQALFDGIVKYTAAYYHGMPVKVYKKPLTFLPHDGSKSTTPKEIDLAFNRQLLSVRTRPCPDGAFPRQLNLNDMIDVLIHILPVDAYAIMMLVEQDIWEDDEDDFTCGRAYGASRVSLVSAARYLPALDASAALDTEHAWPASHCRAYVDKLIAEYERGRAKKKSKRAVTTTDEHANTPMRAAVDAFSSEYTAQRSSVSPALWLSRVCKTVSHELGHCIGMDHCSYYACMMQGTCNAQEDARQPPYLCPVDEAKLLATTKTSSRERARALLKLLDQADWKCEPMFAAYASWIRARLQSEHELAVDNDDSVIFLEARAV